MSAPLRGSRREIALVAGALLLPIPVLAGSGLIFPLPEAVERGIVEGYFIGRPVSSDETTERLSSVPRVAAPLPA